MNQKIFNTLAGIVFLVIAILHLCRFFFRWESIIGGWVVPMWVSVLALVLSGYLAYSALKLRR